VATLSTIEKYLDSYSLEEILNLNEWTEADALLQLVEDGHIELPVPPVDLDG
jgi:hypothetical protein